MQATYVMVANKKVLPLLPKGANVNRLTYGQVAAVGEGDRRQGRRARLGFPAGTQGLIHRFFQGFLVPAFSGGVVTTFDTPQAASGWLYMKNIWGNTHPQSLTYGFMQDPLLNEEVLLAWDHVARLNTALSQRPDTFVVMPSPSGPKGLAYMPVLASARDPETAPNPAGGEGADPAPREHLHAGEDDLGGRLLPGRRRAPLEEHLVRACVPSRTRVKLQQTSPKALPSVLPIGLGSEGGSFTRSSRDTFTRAVLNKEDPRTVLKSEGTELQGVMNRSGAPCWAPDPPSTGTCQVKAS